MRTMLACAAALLLAACSGSGDSARVEMSAGQVELGQMNREFAAALNAKDAALAASLYTEDAVLIPPGEAIVHGRAGVEEYWRGALEHGAVRDVSVETMDAYSSGSLGYETGKFKLKVTGPDGQDVVEEGRYIELLRRGPDGKWYSTHGIWNAAPE